LPARQAARLSYITEGSSTGVLKQAALSDTGDEQIRKTVVVVVAHGDSHAVHLNIESRPSGDVRERAISIVVVEPQGRTLPLVARPIHPIDDENVLPAVLVVIDERAPRPKGLWKELRPEGAAVVLEANTGRLRDIH